MSDLAVKRQIRAEAERAKQESYRTAAAEWRQVLEPLGTDEHNLCLEIAPE